jgi:hypothetical protein
MDGCVTLVVTWTDSNAAFDRADDSPFGDAALAEHIPVEGPQAVALPGLENIILWEGMSEEFMAVVNGVMVSGRTELEPTSVLTYLADGAVLALPLMKARSSREAARHKRAHWAPICLNTKRAAAAEMPQPRMRRFCRIDH